MAFYRRTAHSWKFRIDNAVGLFIRKNFFPVCPRWTRLEQTLARAFRRKNTKEENGPRTGIADSARNICPDAQIDRLHIA